MSEREERRRDAQYESRQRSSQTRTFLCLSCPVLWLHSSTLLLSQLPCRNSQRCLRVFRFRTFPYSFLRLCSNSTSSPIYPATLPVLSFSFTTSFNRLPSVTFRQASFVANSDALFKGRGDEEEEDTLSQAVDNARRSIGVV